MHKMVNDTIKCVQMYEIKEREESGSMEKWPKPQNSNKEEEHDVTGQPREQPELQREEEVL